LGRTLVGYASSSKPEKKLTRIELLELANFLYSRYEAKKKLLKNIDERPIIKMDTNHVKFNK